MIRVKLAAVIAVLATSAAAQTETAVIGANRPVASTTTKQKNLVALRAALDAAQAKAQESINAGVASIKNVEAAKKA
ncbi:hypothetical protein [Sphingomonas sp. Leaf30]|nr:hypothetical protein [Sphingomonas sp. Leaf30]KQN20846.1 hypothetical protein ASE89_15330 [Sphingomonas sp. Leaf30]